MAVSLSTITQTMLDILREEWFSTAYPQTLCELFANSSQQDILAGRVIHPFTKEEAQWWQLHFLNVDVFYDNVKPTSLTADCAVGDVTLLANTTDYPASGSLCLWGQCVDYTGITATSFTGVTPLLFAFIAGTSISIAFKLPTNFGSTIGLIYKNKFAVPEKHFDTMFNDLNNLKWGNHTRNDITSFYENQYMVDPFYVIKDTTYLIIYQLNETGASIRFRYVKVPPTMTSIQGSIIDNDVYAQQCISELAVANMLFHRGEENRAGQIFNLAISDVRKLYSWYNDIEFESQNGKAYTMGKGKRNI